VLEPEILSWLVVASCGKPAQARPNAEKDKMADKTAEFPVLQGSG